MKPARTLDPDGLGFIVLAGALTAQAAIAIDALLPALPTVVAELGMNPGSVQLTIGLFMAGFALGQIAWGWAADWLGRRPVILIGTGGFILATAMCALADDGNSLIAWRLLQGLSSSASMAATRAMMRDHFTGVPLARKMAAMTAVFFLSPILAPQLGGLLLAIGGWRSVFLVPGVVAAAGLLVSWRALAESHPASRRQRRSAKDIGHAISAIVRHPLSGLCLGIQGAMSIGLLTWISSCSLIITGYYGLSVTAFGLLFAATATVQLGGSILCNQMLKFRGPPQVMALGAACVAIGGTVVLLVGTFWPGPLAALIGGMWVFMLGFGLIVPSSGGMALHAFGAMGGLAAAVLGSAQSLVGSTGSLLSALLYDGTPRSLGIGVALSAGLAFVFAASLSLRLARRPGLLAHAEEIVLTEEIT